MYIAGVGNASVAPDPSQRGSNSATWHKGAMSKRFDIKEEPPSSITKPLVVRIQPVVDLSKHLVPLANNKCELGDEQFRRSSCNGSDVQSSNSKLGGNPRKDDPVGVALMRFYCPM